MGRTLQTALVTWLHISLLSGIYCSGPFHEPNYFPSRDVMVHLFEWRWPDIANECEKFLAPMGYAGVQVSPPNENVVFYKPPFMPEVDRPWFERYQPVSYKLTTRSGNEEEFRDMVRRCNQVGVRIYVDAVLNHMTGIFPDGTNSTGGSKFSSQKLSYEDVQVRNCRLVQLTDLDQSRESVQMKMATYMNHLLEIGVAGFRIDAAKHMWPQDLEAIYGKLNALSVDFFPPDTQPLLYQEVIDLGEESIKSADYARLGRVTEFKYGQKLGIAFQGYDQLRWLSTFGEDWGLLPSDDALAFIDNHDNQRGHGGGGGNILTFFQRELYQKAVAFMLAWPYGLKQVMSSYYWERKFENGKDVNDWVGPPHDDQYNILPVVINEDDSCGNGWICEHRWPLIAQMVRFSIESLNQPVENWWDNGQNQIAFSRGAKGFLAINNDHELMRAQIQSGLPAGFYCDIASGVYTNQVCTGRLVTVPWDGKVYINLPNYNPGIMALHIGAMVTEEDDPGLYTTSSKKRTVVMIYKQSDVPVFMRGGISYERRNECRRNSQRCTIPIEHRLNHTQDEVFLEWAREDHVLDWNGAENDQGNLLKKEVIGTPLLRTTNDKQSDSFYELNSYGKDYWVLDVTMDCSYTDSGWFEFKVVTRSESGDPEWESEINQESECSGNTYRAQMPFWSMNHVVMCGKINVFSYEANQCLIKDF